MLLKPSRLEFESWLSIRWNIKALKWKIYYSLLYISSPSHIFIWQSDFWVLLTSRQSLIRAASLAASGQLLWSETRPVPSLWEPGWWWSTFQKITTWKNGRQVFEIKVQNEPANKQFTACFHRYADLKVTAALTKYSHRRHSSQLQPKPLSLHPCANCL